MNLFGFDDWDSHPKFNSLKTNILIVFPSLLKFNYSFLCITTLSLILLIMLHQYFVFVKIITYYNANINFSTKSHHQQKIQMRSLMEQIKLRIQVTIYSLIITK